jgi:hypothetical protein
MSPTLSTGWISISSYTRDDCEGTPTAATGYPTGMCIKERYTMSPTEVMFSFRFDCTEGAYYDHSNEQFPLLFLSFSSYS